jgi:catechol 2,3-dioxygenase-like lactoylglutathione lyase family enzyme
LKVGHIEIFVEDPLRAKEFYEKILGFELIEIQNAKFVWMKSGDKEFLLRPGKNIKQTGEYKDSDIGFVLYTDNLEQTKKELVSKGLELKGTDGSENCLTFTDPDGNWFQLVNPDHS